MGTAIKHPVPDRVKTSFVIFDIWALWPSEVSVRVPGRQKLYGNTAVGVKGLNTGTADTVSPPETVS